MAKEGLYDMVVEELHRRRRLVRAEVHKRFKGDKPFRMEPVSDAERIMQYMDFTKDPATEQDFMAKGMNPQAIQAYHQQMQDLIRRVKNA